MGEKCACALAQRGSGRRHVINQHHHRVAERWFMAERERVANIAVAGLRGQISLRRGVSHAFQSTGHAQAAFTGQGSGQKLGLIEPSRSQPLGMKGNRHDSRRVTQ